MRIHFVYLSILFVLFIIFLFLVKHINVDKEIGGGLYDELKKNSYNFHQLYDIEMEQYNSDNNLVLDTVKLLKANGEFVGI